MASKVLELLWNLTHRDDSPLDTMEHALNAHTKILDYSCSQVIVHVQFRHGASTWVLVLKHA